MPASDIVGVVLAGGGSRRMGVDKALLPLAGETLAERAAAVLGRELDEVVLAAPRSEAMAALGLTLVEDRYPSCGPLAGVHAGLDHAGGRGVFALACDLPFVTVAVVRLLLAAAGVGVGDRRSARAWLAADAEGVQPLCGVFSPACLTVAAARLEAGERSMRGFLEGVDTATVALTEDLPSYHRWLLLNVNRPADYSRPRAAATRQGSP